MNINQADALCGNHYETDFLAPYSDMIAEAFELDHIIIGYIFSLSRSLFFSLSLSGVFSLFLSYLATLPHSFLFTLSLSHSPFSSFCSVPLSLSLSLSLCLSVSLPLSLARTFFWRSISPSPAPCLTLSCMWHVLYIVCSYVYWYFCIHVYVFIPYHTLFYI